MKRMSVSAKLHSYGMKKKRIACALRKNIDNLATENVCVANHSLRLKENVDVKESRF
jgi:hypothetical protein